VKLGVLLGTVLAGTFVLALAVLAGGTGPSVPSAVISVTQVAAEACAVTGPVPGLGAQEAADADAVVSTAMAETGGDARAARTAVAAALAMSGLDDLAGPGKGPFGLFGELPSTAWGTAAQLMSPPAATAAFLGHLTAVPGWRSMAPWQAAQEAELPARAPLAVLQADWGRAGQVVAAVVRNADVPGGCGQGGGALAGPAGRYGLPEGYVVPPGTPPEHAAAVGFALAQCRAPLVLTF
jgi:hypothetical protein